MASFGRALGVLRTGSQLLRRGTQMITIRNGSGTPTIVPRYRQFPIISKTHILKSELLSGAMWFWILWHSWHDPDIVMVSNPASVNFNYTVSSPKTEHESKHTLPSTPCMSMALCCRWMSRWNMRLCCWTKLQCPVWNKWKCSYV